MEPKKDTLPSPRETHKAMDSVLGVEKPTFEQYNLWLKNVCGIEITKKTRTYYEQITNKIKYDFESSDLWNGLKDNIVIFNEEYKLQKDNYSLLLRERGGSRIPRPLGRG